MSGTNMSKQEFLERLRAGLSMLPAAEAERSLSFYAEMIDDRTEDGQPEQDAVAAMGDPAEVARAIVAELPAIPKAIVKSKTKSHTLNWILALVLSPFWVTLLLAFACLAFAVYITIWALAVTVWVLAVGLLCGGPLGIAVAAYCLFIGQPVVAMWQLGSGLLLFGLGVFCLAGAKRASQWLVGASRRYADKVRSLFVKKARPAAEAAAVEKEEVGCVR